MSECDKLLEEIEKLRSVSDILAKAVDIIYSISIYMDGITRPISEAQIRVYNTLKDKLLEAYRKGCLEPKKG